MNVTILGPGRWGSFITWYLDKNKHNVKLWGLSHDAAYQNFLVTRKNAYVELPASVDMTTNLEEALNHADHIIISISAQAVRDLMTKVSLFDGYKNKKFILCMKGIEDQTGNRLSNILIEFGVPKENIAVWVGPGHIQAFTAGVPSCMIIDSYNDELSSFLINSFKSDLIRFYQGTDIIGSEIGAAAKNVMGIAAGLLDGMNYASLKGGLMARGTFEVARLIKACGGNELSAYGLCHLGDYEATLFSQFSHNRMFGELFAKGESFAKLAEGVSTSSAMLKLAESVNVELPITKTVYDVIHGNITKEQAIKQLFARDNIREFDKF